MDGVGEWTTTSAWVGENNKIKPLWEISFPHSLDFCIHLLLIIVDLKLILASIS